MNSVGISARSGNDHWGEEGRCLLNSEQRYYCKLIGDERHVQIVLAGYRIENSNTPAQQLSHFVFNGEVVFLQGEHPAGVDSSKVFLLKEPFKC